MNFQFTHPIWLLLLIPGLAWVLWFAFMSEGALGHQGQVRRFPLANVLRFPGLRIRRRGEPVVEAVQQRLGRAQAGIVVLGVHVGLLSAMVQRPAGQ